MCLSFLHAQTPLGMNYQMVLRDGKEVLSNHALNVRFSILKGTGLVSVYQETHFVNSNSYGLVSTVIGEGSVNSGNFSTIDWGGDSFYLQVELDKGNGFIDMGMNQLVSVPYSFLARTAETIDDHSINDLNDVISASASIGETLKWDGTEWIPSIDQVDDSDNDPTNELQSLVLNGLTLSLSTGGGSVMIDSSLWEKAADDVFYIGGGVGIETATPKATLHVDEGHTVLFGADTLGKSNFFPDPKMMFLPGKGGAFRVGQLNADGSLISGTGYNYWDPGKVGWASIAIGNNTRSTGAGSVALGIRAYAGNFGSVALGHLSRARGNSAVAAGYYTRADAFVGTAVGCGNVGGGSANSWNATDPIFEVGNSIDTASRSNAFTVLKNGRVGINHANPQSMLDIEQPNQGPGNGVLLNLAGIGHWETGVDNSADYNFYFNNSLKSYILDTDGSYHNASDRRLKQNIRELPQVLHNVLQLNPSLYHFKDASPGAPVSIGFIAQEVEPLFPYLVSVKNGFLGLNYSGFSVLAIQAIQDQQAIIDQQTELINALYSELRNIQDRLSRLEQ